MAMRVRCSHGMARAVARGLGPRKRWADRGGRMTVFAIWAPTDEIKDVLYAWILHPARG